MKLKSLNEKTIKNLHIIKRLFSDKNYNLRTILNLIIENPGVANVEMMIKLRDMDQTAISQCVADLLKMNLIYQDKEGKFRKHYPVEHKIDRLNKLVDNFQNGLNKII